MLVPHKEVVLVHDTGWGRLAISGSIRARRLDKLFTAGLATGIHAGVHVVGGLVWLLITVIPGVVHFLAAFDQKSLSLLLV